MTVEAKIKKGLSRKHNPVCYQLQQDIILPKGTILREVEEDTFVAKVGFSGVAGEFSVTVKPGALVPADALKRVIAA